MSNTQLNTFPWTAAPDSPFHKGLARPLLVAAQVLYVVYLSAGHFKENLTSVPFDLTIAAGVVVAALSLLIFLIDGGRVPHAVIWMGAFFAVMAVSTLWTEWTPYAIEKTTRFFTLTLLGAVLPGVILKDLKGVKRFVWSLIVLGIVVSSGVVLEVVRGGFSGDIAERATGFTTVTTALGWDAGQALVGLYALMLRGGKWIWLSFICVPLFVVLVASGARGPLFIAVAVIVFFTLRFSKPGNLNLWIALAIIAVALIGLSGFSSLLPQGSVRRIEKVLQGQEDRSADARGEAGAVALREMEKDPLFGLGFGGFGRVYNFGSVTDRIYPHNVFLEIGVENGVLVALFFTALVLASTRRTYREAVAQPMLRPFLAILLFTIGNSIISGEINANRIFYGLLVIGLMLPTMTAEANELAEI